MVDEKDGMKVSGMGILINKLDDLIGKVDRTNQLLSFVEKKIETLNSNLNNKV